MKTVTVMRLLLGLMFVVFGLNGFLHFIPQPPPPPGLAGEFLGALVGSHYVLAVALLQVVGGLLMLWGRYLPLGLVLLGPVIVNILLFHALMAPAGIAPGLVALVLFLVVFSSEREAFVGVFRA